MTTARESIKLVSAALDEDKQDNIVLRGVIEPASLYQLKVGSYQREVLPLSKIKDLEEAFTEGGNVPDIDLGMRGGNFIEKEGAFFLQDDVFIIDGLQRVTAAKKVIEEGKVPRLGGIVHFNTTEEWERNRFRILNTLHTKLSPNIMIRNMESDYSVVELLHTITKDKNFVLGGKVCWNQRMLRSSELISAFTFLKAAGALHTRFGVGTTGGASYREIIPNLEKIYIKLGRGVIRENVKMYWNVLDECFNIRFTVYKEMAPHLKLSFLLAIANIFADHSVFWKDAVFFVPSILRKKISQFPVLDPKVAQLSGTGGGVGSQMLYDLMLKHINKGKTTQRLVPARRSLKQSKKEQQKQEEDETE